MIYTVQYMLFLRHRRLINVYGFPFPPLLFPLPQRYCNTKCARYAAVSIGTTVFHHRGSDYGRMNTRKEKSYSYRLEVANGCDERNEYVACFKFVVECLQTNKGDIKFKYDCIIATETIKYQCN